MTSTMPPEIKKLEQVNEFFSSLSTEGSNAFLYIRWMHSAAHIRCRAGTSTNSWFDYVPKTVLSRLHRLAKESKKFCSKCQILNMHFLTT
jgi:hypothetical protein